MTYPVKCLLCRKVWDALTGDVLHSFEHKHIVRACAFSEVKLVLHSVHFGELGECIYGREKDRKK